MARLYADEHVPLAVIAALSRSGHDVVRAREVLPEGTRDDEHFRVAILEERLVLTQESDFLALSARILEDGGRHPVVYWPQEAYTIGHASTLASGTPLGRISRQHRKLPTSRAMQTSQGFLVSSAALEAMADSPASLHPPHSELAEF